MSILRALNTGSSGLRSHGNAIGVTGDNIANVNTVGFKQSRAGFEDVLGRSIGNSGTTPQAGAGSRLGHVEQLWTQGSLLTTDSPTDVALSGEGFFVVKGNAGGVNGQFYTRAGQFQIAPDNRLTTVDGLAVQGYTADETGTLSATVGDLVIPGGTVAANPTADITMALNLDSNATVPAAFDPLNPDTTSNFSTGVTVYDSLGNSHEISVYFRRSAANTWEWHGLVDGGELAGGTPGVATEIANGTLAFTSNGELNTETVGANTANFLNATAGQALTFDFGTSITEGGTGLDATTQFADESTTNALTQDGYGAGSVSGIQIDADGRINGVFSNGQRRVLGQLAVADFASVDGLERAGKSLWIASEASGEPLIGTAQSGGRGSVVAGSLEQSNVDLGQEFVNLISYQRGFQANARIITTADDMYGELVNLKR